jgi:hypothetical protein
LGRILEPGVDVDPRAMHLGYGDERIPVGHRTEPGPRVQVDAGQSERRRHQRARLLAVRAKGLAVLVEFGVEAPWAPTREHLRESHVLPAARIPSIGRLAVGPSRSTTHQGDLQRRRLKSLSSIPRVAKVSGFVRPVTLSPCVRWEARSADAVSKRTIPSMGPGS